MTQPVVVFGVRNNTRIVLDRARALSGRDCVTMCCEHSPPFKLVCWPIDVAAATYPVARARLSLGLRQFVAVAGQFTVRSKTRP